VPLESSGRHDRLLPTGRLEAFSDGVFAISITLLVLELHVPGRDEVLVRSLEHEWPRYLGYFMAVSVLSVVEPLRHLHLRRRASPPG
jgi:uncharacterized membrane protein